MMSCGSFAIISLPQIFRRSPFASGMPCGAPFNRYACVPLWARAILRAIRNFKICARGRLPDLKPFGFIIFLMETLWTSFGFCTANEMLNASLNVREPSEILSAGCRTLDGREGGILTQPLLASYHVFSNLHENRMNTGDFYGLLCCNCFNCSA